MKYVWWIVIAALALTVGIVCFAFYEHNQFQNSFGVNPPWFMDQDERALLQPFVTKKLQELDKKLTEAKSTDCADAKCMQEKLDNFHGNRELLDDATSAAGHFDFETSVAAPKEPKPSGSQ